MKTRIFCLFLWMLSFLVMACAPTTVHFKELSSPQCTLLDKDIQRNPNRVATIVEFTLDCGHVRIRALGQKTGDRSWDVAFHDGRGQARPPVDDMPHNISLNDFEVTQAELERILRVPPGFLDPSPFAD